MRHLVFAVLCSFSLGACAQSAPPQDGSGQKISVGSNSPAATKPIAEPSFAAGSPQERVRNVLKGLNPAIRVDSIEPSPVRGFHQVVAGGQVVYVSDDGKYLFQGELMDVGAFVRQPLAVPLLLTLLGIAVSGGMFVVPLYAFLTTFVDKSQTARTIAANNIVNSGAMVAGSLLAMGLGFAGVGTVDQLLMSAAMCLISAWLAQKLHRACD